eukprot:gene19343-biopygen18671
MDDCSVLRVTWRRGRRRRDFVDGLPADTGARIGDMWLSEPGEEKDRVSARGVAWGGDGGRAKKRREDARGSAWGSGKEDAERGGPIVPKAAAGAAERTTAARGTAWSGGGSRAAPRPEDAWGSAWGGEGARGAEAQEREAAGGDQTEPPAGREYVVNDHVRVYTDGAGRHNQDPSIRHAGSGAFWGPEHPYNISVPVKGGATEQTNIRGELLAIVLAVERDPRALEICTDSQWTIDRIRRDLSTWRGFGWRRTLNGSRPEHVDLWKRLGRQLTDPTRGAVRFRYVKGHAKEQDVASGRVEAADKFGNDAADALAVEGAALHGVPRERVAAARRRVRVARAVQKMMLDIAWERARVREREKMPHGGAAGEEGAEMKDHPDAEPEEPEDGESGERPSQPPTPRAAAAEAAPPPPAAAAAPEPQQPPPPPPPPAAAAGGEDRIQQRYKYPWGWDPPGDRQKMPLERAKMLPVPRGREATADKSCFVHGPRLWHARIRYYRALEWPPAGAVGGENGVTWLELAVDFEVTTGLDLPRKFLDDGYTPSGEPPGRGPFGERMRIMASVSHRVVALLGEDIVPGGLPGKKRVGGKLVMKKGACGQVE